MSGIETDRPGPAAAPDPGRTTARRRLLLALLPLAVAGVVGYFLYAGLSLDPKQIPSVLIDKPAPEFDLPPIPGRPEPGLSRADLIGQVSLVNVFASWCVPCRYEHPFLLRLKHENVVPIYGLNYKNDPADAVEWLDRFASPYQRIGSDLNGRVGIDWGVYGVPETFLIGADGRILCKQIGPIDERALKGFLLPAIEAAKAGREVAC